MSVCLALETSLFGASLALFEQGQRQGTLWQHIHPEAQGSAAMLSQMLASGLQATGLQARQIEGLVVSVGPGSFTGIKIGLAWAYGFYSARIGGLPCLGLSALEEAGQGLCRMHKLTRATLLLPSTRTHGYAALVAGDHELVQRSLLVETQGEGLKRLVQAMGEQDMPVFWAKPWEEMASVLRPHYRQDLLLSAEGILETALLGLVAKARSVPWQAWETSLPLARYLRASTAEERLLQASQNHLKGRA